MRAKLPDPRVLLAWYDRHRRVLPWRSRKGETPDPYRVWLSEIMLQQTTVKAVAPYYARFLKHWPTVEELATAELEDVLRGLGRAWLLRAGAKPASPAREPWRGRGGALSGHRRRTDRAARHRRLHRRGDRGDRLRRAGASAVDGNVERVVARLFALEHELPARQAEAARTRAAAPAARSRSATSPQALMDLGATICTPKTPACSLCPWSDACAAPQSAATRRLSRARRRSARARSGAAPPSSRCARTAHILLRRRPPKGLLGGMSEVPGSEWAADFDIAKARAQISKLAPRLGKVEWRRRAGVVTHVFTHFPLELTVFVGRVPRGTPAPDGTRWVKLAAVAGEALPNVMRKVVAHALEGGDERKRARGRLATELALS